MSETRAQTQDATPEVAAPTTDLKLEVVVIPVSDVDRAKSFYRHLGWRLDADFPFENGFRIVQLTPPGSPTSVQFGTNLTSATPGSGHGHYLVVSDIVAAHDELADRRVDVSDVFHPETPGSQFQPDGSDGRAEGRAPDGSSYGSFFTFDDPDGNSWLVQEVTQRLPGRVTSTQPSFASSRDLSQALQRAATAHGEHEKRNGGEYDEQWADWYAAYMTAEQNGDELPT
jgi:catechol 2,3-dioxygenase-like lactoylglutathione lyase family enzyme